MRYEYDCTMLTSDDIKYMAHSGEGYNVEFKESVPQKVKELAEEICAFANSSGGYLLIGINDKNLIVGENVDLTEIQVKVFELIQNNENITTDEISKTLSISRRYATSIIKRLKTLELVERNGSDKTGIWKIKLK